MAQPRTVIIALSAALLAGSAYYLAAHAEPASPLASTPTRALNPTERPRKKPEKSSERAIWRDLPSRAQEHQPEPESSQERIARMLSNVDINDETSLADITQMWNTKE